MRAALQNKRCLSSFGSSATTTTGYPSDGWAQSVRRVPIPHSQRGYSARPRKDSNRSSVTPPSHVKFKEFLGRPHFPGAPGWEEVADFVLEWALNPVASDSRKREPARA